MKDHVRLPLVALAALPFLASLSLAHGGKPVKAAAYAKTEAVLKEKCVACHQGAAPSAGVNLSSYAMVMRSKYKGKPIVVPKKTADSVIVASIHGKGVMKMPPGGSLSAVEMKTIESWIAAGAKP